MKGGLCVAGPNTPYQPYFGGSYYESAFLDPVFSSVFDTAISTASGAYRGMTGGSLFDMPKSISDMALRQKFAPGEFDSIGGAMANAVGFPLRVLGQGLAATGRAAGYAVGAGARAVAGTTLESTVPVGKALFDMAPLLPALAIGAVAQGIKSSATVAQYGIQAAGGIWNSPLLGPTKHWTGEFGMKQWKSGPETLIMGGYLAVGAAKGAYEAWNEHRLGYIDGGQLAGSLTPPRNYGRTIPGESDPTRYDGGADGNLVFALNTLRRG